LSHRRYARITLGAVAEGVSVVTRGASGQGVSFPRRIAPIDRRVESGSGCRRGIALIDRPVESSGGCGGCVAPSGCRAASSGRRIIVVVAANGLVGERRRRERRPAVDRIVVVRLVAIGGVV